MIKTIIHRYSYAQFTPLLAVLAAALLASNAWALSYPTLSFQDFVKKSTRIVVATVERIDSDWEETEEGKAIYSTLTLSVSQTLRGKAEHRFAIRQFGGEDFDGEGIGMMIAGAPQLKIGDKVILFLHGRTESDIPYTHGERGVLRVVNENGRDVVRTYAGRPVLGIGKNGLRVGPKAETEPKIAIVYDADGNIESQYVPPVAADPITLTDFVSAFATYLHERGIVP